MGKYSRKFKRGDISENVVKLQATDEAIAMVYAAMAGIMWNDLGKLYRNKKTRLKTFKDLFREKLEHIRDIPTGKQLEAELELLKQTGDEILR